MRHLKAFILAKMTAILMPPSDVGGVKTVMF